MKTLILLLSLSLSAFAQVVPGGSAPGGTITGQIQTPTGGAIKGGTLTFSLSQPAIVSGAASVATQQVACYTSAAGNIVGVPDPIVLPIVSANLAFGTLPAGTYYIEFYYTSSNGTSAVSPELTFALSSAGTININPPSLQPASATGFGVAIGTTSGGEIMQGSVTGWTQFQQNQPLLSGSTAPTVNTSSCNIYFSDQLIPTGTYYTVSLVNKQGSLISGFPQTWCTYGGSGGTINVSQGAPTGNCNTTGVFYPTPIFANSPNGFSQSVSGPITFSGNITSSGNNTFSGSNAFTGLISFSNAAITSLSASVSLSAPAVNGVTYANLLPGGDIGAQLNNCIALYPTATTPGICMIAPGSYTLTTTVIKPQWVTINGNNAVISINTLATPGIICATTQTLYPTLPGTYSRRGISNLTLIGSGPTATPYGIWIGGDPANTVIVSTAEDFLEVFDNVHVQNFGAGYTLGSNISQELWLGGSIMGGYAAAENGVVMPSGAGHSENLTFDGTQFVSGGGNTGFAILVPNANGSTINLDHVSVDYWGSGNSGGCPNSLGTGQIEFNAGHLVVDGGHFETCSGIQILSNTSTIVEYSIVGGTEFTLADATHALSTAAVIQVASTVAQVSVEAGTVVGLASGATQTIGAYVNNTASGGQVYVGQYASLKGSGYNQIPALGGTWNAGIQPALNSGSLVGYEVIGTFQTTSSMTIGSNGTASTLRQIKRMSTGSISGTTRAEVLLSWPNTFTDTNYTVECNVEDSTTAAASQGLTFERIRTKSATQVGAVIYNPTGGGITGTLDCSADHD